MGPGMDSRLPSAAPPRARAPWLAIGLLALAVLALYAPSVGDGFVAFDDPAYIGDNPVVARGLTWEGVRWAFGFHAGNWHPLTWLAHMLDVELFGPSAAGAMHLVAAFLHALNAALLALALTRMTRAPWSSLAVAALFALHPLRVESVAWASERKDVLSGTFWMLTLLAYEAWARRGGATRFALVLVSLALGLLAKSMLVTLPVVLLLLDAWPLERLRSSPAEGAGVRRAVLLEKLVLLLPCLAVAAATLWIQRDEGAVGSLSALGPLARASNACLSFWIYLGKTLVPTSLACFVPHPVVVTPREELAQVLFRPGLVACVALLAVTLFAWRQRRARPHLWLGWAWYLVVALPVIGLVQVGQQAYADRYTYLPLIGPVLALVFELRARALAAPRARPWIAALVGAACVALVPLTMRQIGTWRDSRTLFEHATAVTRANYLAETFLGEIERRRGNPQVAREHLERALEANKFHVPAMLELGRTLEALGDLPGARRLYNRTLRNAPGDPAARRALEELERRSPPDAAPGPPK